MENLVYVSICQQNHVNRAAKCGAVLELLVFGMILKSMSEEYQTTKFENVVLIGILFWILQVLH